MAIGRDETNIQNKNIVFIEKKDRLTDKVLSKESISDMCSKELKKRGIEFIEKSDYKNAQEFLNTALTRVIKEPLIENDKNLIIAECCSGLANCELKQDRVNEAIDLFIKAKKHVDMINSAYVIENLQDTKYHIAYRSGIAFLLIEAYDKAIFHFHDALSIAQSKKNHIDLAAVKSYYGLSLVLAKKIKEGLIALTEARELYLKNQRENSIGWASHCLMMAKAYESIGDYTNALIEYSQLRTLRIQSRIGDANAGLGRVYLLLGCNEEAKEYLKEAIQNYSAQNATKKLDAVRDLLSKANLLPSSTQTPSNLFYIPPSRFVTESNSRCLDNVNSSKLGFKKK